MIGGSRKSNREVSHQAAQVTLLCQGAGISRCLAALIHWRSVTKCQFAEPTGG